MRSRLCFVLSLLLVALLPTWASANPTLITDNGPRLATSDGTVWVNEYPGASTGINVGFGGIIGAGTTLSVDSGPTGLVNFGLDGSAAGFCSPNNIIVIYIDSRLGGFLDTSSFNDFGDAHRAAISARGLTAPGRADITFAPGFGADYAIAINRDFAGLWELTPGIHTFLSPLFATPSGLSWDDNCEFELAGLTLANLGLAPGTSFDYVVTLVNPNDAGGAYRSDEFHGVASTTIGGNPGINPILLSPGDFNTFASVGPYPIINEVDADTPGTDAAEFVELWDGGVGNLPLDGLVVVLFNGSNNLSYAAYDLDGLVTSPTGYLIIGNAALSPAITFAGNFLQNGQDAVALYAANGTDWPNSMLINATNLIDLVVYDTSDPDDPELLAFLLSGPQVNEDAHLNGANESIQRCPDGTGGYRVTDNFIQDLPTAGAANNCPAACTVDADCATCEVCGNTGYCEPAVNGLACDLDSSLCTLDSCQAGTCTAGAAVDCTSNNTDCQTASCDGTSGLCSIFADKLDGTVCDLDAIPCTLDTCQTGACAAGANTCECITTADCAGMEDGNLCNGTLVCVGFACVLEPTTVVICDASGDTTCAVNTCAPSTGVCSMQNANEAGSCDDGDACTVADVCTAGTCGGSAMDCSGSDTACQTASCNAGACTTMTDRANDTVCDLDSSMCTPDTCQTGTCTAGTAVDCSSSDTACQTASCNPGTGACTVMNNVLDGTTCDLDSSMCTPDTCQTGTCAAGTAVDCSGFDTDCQTASCNAGTGACTTFSDVMDGTSCDLDATSCTPDTCLAGSCSAGTNTCGCIVDADCAASEDGDLCNGTLICTGNTCVVDATTVVTCDASGDTACAVNTCAPSTGVCSMQNANEAGSCDDGDACTVSDVCAAGTCGGSAMDCSGSDTACQTASCNAGACTTLTDKANDTACDLDSSMCTPDTCQTGTCTAGAAIDCSSSDTACQTASCDAGTGACTIMNNAADDTVCDLDSSMCTPDTCQIGMCTAGTAVDCSSSDTACQTASCDAGTGACTTMADKANDTVCDLDSSMCTPDTCQTGTCTAGTAVDCLGSDTACQTAACDAATGACTTMTNKANNTSCDLDSSMCTPDTCQAGACTAATAISCSGSDTACQTASCNASTGACTTMTNRTNGTSCDLDGTTCTPDTCQAGVCSAGTSTCACITTADCAASEDGDLCNGTLLCTNNACVVDTATVVTCDTTADGTCAANTCNTATGVCAMVNLNEAGSCDDANSCTDTDVCTAGVCAGTPLATGTDCSDDCNSGVCNMTTGLCEQTPLVDGTTCDDGSNCTETDVCTAGVCSGTLLADDTACDDGDLCTETDVCASGVCSGTDLDCSLLDDACNVGTCNSADGACVATAMADGTSCDDGEQCTETDECAAGVCAGTAAADGTACDDADTCTEGETCEAGLCSGGSDVCTIGDEVAEPAEDVTPDGTSDASITDLISGAETSAELKGDGCQCQVSTQQRTSPALPMGLLLGLIGLFVVRRRRG